MIPLIQYFPSLIEERDVMAFALRWLAHLYGQFLSDVPCLTGQEQVVAAYSGDGDVIGVVVWEVDEHDRTAWIALAAVNESHQQLGVFKAMMKRALDKMAEAQNVRSVCLSVAVQNEKAQAVYRKIGFNHTFSIFERVL